MTLSLALVFLFEERTFETFPLQHFQKSSVYVFLLIADFFAYFFSFLVRELQGVVRRLLFVKTTTRFLHFLVPCIEL